MVSEAIILAGGLGTRLRSVVPDLPKSMASVAGQPFLSYLLQLLEMNGVRHAVLAVGYRNEVIREFFGPRFGSVQLTYSVELEPLGTGGALRQALEQVRGSFTFVLNGDTFLRLGYQQMASLLEHHPESRLVVALRRIDNASRYGEVAVARGRIESFTARGSTGSGLINAGSYLVARNLFEHYAMPAKFSWEHDFLERYASQVQPLALECDEPFIDIGMPEALEQAQTLIPRWINAPADAASPRDSHGIG